MKKNRCLYLLSLTVLLTAGCLALSGCGEVNTDSSNIESLSRDLTALPEETLPGTSNAGCRLSDSSGNTAYAGTILHTGA